MTGTRGAAVLVVGLAGLLLTLAGVSAFQLNFSSGEVFTPGDDLDVLVAMNPAALQTNLADLVPGGILIVDAAEFTESNLEKAGYTKNPLEDGSLAGYQLYPIEVTRLTMAALKDLIRDLSRQYAIPSERIGTHKDFAQTACPGKNLEGEVRRIAAELAANP